MRIDPTLYTGRPVDAREPVEQRCYDFLDSLGLRYWRVDHERAETIAMCEEVETVLGCKICKNLFLTNRQQTDFYLLLMPGEKPFKTKLLSKQIGTARLSFATPEHMRQYLGLTPGSVSVLGLLNDREKKVRLLLDSDLKKESDFGCHPCLNSASLRFSTEDLLRRVLPALGVEATWVELPWELEE